jgi:hypothetical protein
VLAAVAALTATGAQASAWRECSGNKIRWNDHWTNMYISTTSFPAGSVWDSDLQDAMWRWNRVGGSDFTYYVGRDTDGTHNDDNGRNEVYLSSDDAGSALAVTLVRSHCYWFFGYSQGIDETDIAFNSAVAWNTGAFNYANLGSPYHFEQAALHELGHALGLTHENRMLALMNAAYPAGGPLGYWKESDPLGDDRRGSRILYGDGTSETDVAGSAMKQVGSDGGAGLVSSPSSAARGSSVTLEFTFSNLGTATASFGIGFYLSTDSYITTADRLLGSNSSWGDSGFTGTFSRTLTIPADVAPGTYWLGFRIDPSNAIGEANEGNNNQPMPRAITIY